MYVLGWDKLWNQVDIEKDDIYESLHASTMIYNAFDAIFVTTLLPVRPEKSQEL